MKTVKADLQNYLRSRSDMSIIDFRTVMERALSTLGMGGIIGITTFHDRRYEDAKEQCKRQGIEIKNNGNAFHVPLYDLLFVKCQRIMTQQGDLDVIGVREHHHLPEHLSLEDTIKAVKDEDALCDIPHPFNKRGLGPFIREHPEYLARIDAITTFSGEGALWMPHLLPKGCTTNPNEQALQWYHEVKTQFPHLGAICASNGSRVNHIGTNYVIMPMPNEYGLLFSSRVTAAIKQGLQQTTPEKAKQTPLYGGALRHQLVVLVDHNPISYKLKGIPNQDLDYLFAKK